MILITLKKEVNFLIGLNSISRTVDNTPLNYLAMLPPERNRSRPWVYSYHARQTLPRYYFCRDIAADQCRAGRRRV